VTRQKQQQKTGNQQLALSTRLTAGKTGNRQSALSTRLTAGKAGNQHSALSQSKEYGTEEAEDWVRFADACSFALVNCPCVPPIRVECA
jgi:hypothetical protein